MLKKKPLVSRLQKISTNCFSYRFLDTQMSWIAGCFFHTEMYDNLELPFLLFRDLNLGHRLFI